MRTAIVERALRNALGFCDAIHVADHQSTDRTPEDPRRARRRDTEDRRAPHRRTARIERAAPAVREHADVDLRHRRRRDLRPRRPGETARRFVRRPLRSEWWVVFGNVLNCEEIDLDRRTATGYLAPPCRSMTKLYNFRMLRALDPTAPQRLHSHKGRDVFHEPYHALLRYDLYKETAWEDAHFRCLHACFLPRSSRESEGAPRENVSESLQPMRRLKRLAASRARAGAPLPITRARSTCAVRA